MELEKLLQIGKNYDASDLFLRSDRPISMKVKGDVMPIPGMEGVKIPVKWVSKVLKIIFTEAQITLLKEERSYDIGYHFEGLGHMRIHAFYSKGHVDLVFRYLTQKAPSLQDLNLPPAIRHLAQNIERGLILICGKTGGGKSTTAFAWLNEINTHLCRHIITLENPLEMLFEDNKSIFSQRSLGSDFLSFEDGLKGALRSSPDVIFLGEMRDRATIDAALTAAETGHLVISTVHASNTVECITRLYDLTSQSNTIRTKLSQCCQAIIAQALIPNKNKTHMYPAVEILINSSVVADYIKKENYEGIRKYLESAKHLGMQTLDMSLTYLVQKNIISLKEALKRSENPEALEGKITALISTSKDHTGFGAENTAQIQHFAENRWNKAESISLKENSESLSFRKPSRKKRG